MARSPDPQLVAWITETLDDRTTPEEVLSGILEGRYQLFRYPKGIVITQITGHRRLLVFLLAGKDFEEWKSETTRDLKAFARLNGISIIESYSRPGLEKVLKTEGWKKEQVVLRMRLNEED